jgi:hypothetical protein
MSTYARPTHLPSSGMPRMTVTGKRIISPVTDPINCKTKAYQDYLERDAREAWYQREFAAWKMLRAAAKRQQEATFRLIDRVDAALQIGMLHELTGIEGKAELEAAQ